MTVAITDLIVVLQTERIPYIEICFYVYDKNVCIQGHNDNLKYKKYK